MVQPGDGFEVGTEERDAALLSQDVIVRSMRAAIRSLATICSSLARRLARHE
jgi:hypothetical protein